MTTNVAYVVNNSGATVFLNGKQFAVSRDHVNYSKVVDALRLKQWDKLNDLLDVKASIVNWASSDKDFTVTGNSIALNGIPFPDAAAQKVLAMIRAGNSADALFNFLRKVRQNSSFTSQEELFLFCVANDFMIHEDGDILAYKSVRGDYTDIHSGTVRNKVGDRPKMDRPQVDDRREHTCSVGFHFAAYQYASTWAGNIDGVSRRLMLMKINPKDVVSIPNDYSNQKARCCEYEVIAELGRTPAGVPAPLPAKQVYNNKDIGRPDLDDLSDRSELFANSNDYDVWTDEPVLFDEKVQRWRTETGRFVAARDVESNQ